MPDTRASQYRRDAAIGRVRTLSGWVAAAALLVTGGLSAAVAHALPGRSTAHGATSQNVVPAAPTTVPSGGGGLQPPTQAPSPAAQSPVTQTPAPVVSGGS